jgi:hypothetical protein
MQWIALSSTTGTGSFAAKKEDTTMFVLYFNAMMEGFAEQIGTQLEPWIFGRNAEAFPGLEQKPKLVATKLDKTVDLAELTTWVDMLLERGFSLDDDDAIWIRQRAGMRESLPVDDSETIDEVPDSKESEDSDESKGEDSIDEEDVRGALSAFSQWAMSMTDFGRRLRGLARGLWASEIDTFEFTDSFLSAMERGFEQAWTEGARTCGIEPSDRTDEEATRLNTYIFSQAPYVPGLATWISANTREDDHKLAPVLTRIETWTNRYNEIMGIAQTMACADQLFMWVVGPTDHCDDCATYSGRVYRGSVWASVGARPQSRSLACGGYKCQCKLKIVTSKSVRAWPGRPPRPSGSG